MCHLQFHLCHGFTRSLRIHGSKLKIRNSWFVQSFTIGQEREGCRFCIKENMDFPTTTHRLFHMNKFIVVLRKFMQTGSATKVRKTQRPAIKDNCVNYVWLAV